ncbi:hypothetical protein HQ520_05530 [bacterium]|nr:hypothetical protein [bacterium]
MPTLTPRQARLEIRNALRDLLVPVGFRREGAQVHLDDPPCYYAAQAFLNRQGTPQVPSRCERASGMVGITPERLRELAREVLLARRIIREQAIRGDIIPGVDWNGTSGQVSLGWLSDRMKERYPSLLALTVPNRSLRERN